MCGYQVLGAVGTLPDIFVELEITFFLLRQLLGVKSDAGKKNKAKVDACCVFVCVMLFEFRSGLPWAGGVR
jgi:hypothetical protein